MQALEPQTYSRFRRVELVYTDPHCWVDVLSKSLIQNDIFCWRNGCLVGAKREFFPSLTEPTMKTSHVLGTLAAAAILATGSAMAAPITLTNLDGAFVGFTEFDWSSSGQAVVTGYDTLNTTATGHVDPFRLQYQASAVGIKVNGTDVASALLPGLNSTYEYTIYADLTETVTCLGGPNGCDFAALNLVSGTWQIRYDLSPDANYAAGTGFTDGTALLSGTFDSSTTVLSGQGASNPGNNSLIASLFGTVLSTNLTYVDPTLAGTKATSTLQFGSTQQVGWVAPASINGVPVAATSNTNFVAQADANQSFTTVPEPGSVALVGLALGAAGFAARRRKAA